MIRSLLITCTLALGHAGHVMAQPPPDVQKKMDEIHRRPRYFWCSEEQAETVLRLIVMVDGKVVGQFRIPVTKGGPENIPAEEPQKVAKYEFVLNEHGRRRFRGVANGAVEGNFWVGLANESEIWLGHSWVSNNQVILHEMLTLEVGKPTNLKGSGIKIEATWVKPLPPA